MMRTAATCVVLVLAAAAALNLWAQIVTMHRVYAVANHITPGPTVGRRVRRLTILRGGAAVARFLAAMGAFTLVVGGDSSSAIALLGTAAMWWLGGWCWRRLGAAPWWAAGLNQ